MLHGRFRLRHPQFRQVVVNFIQAHRILFTVLIFLKSQSVAQLICHTVLIQFLLTLIIFELAQAVCASSVFFLSSQRPLKRTDNLYKLIHISVIVFHATYQDTNAILASFLLSCNYFALLRKIYFFLCLCKSSRCRLNGANVIHIVLYMYNFKQ